MATSTAPLLEIPAGRVDAKHRERLVFGLLLSIEERGFAGSTVGDIVRHAQVSKRTFYQHFADKDEALRSLYEHAVGNLKERMVAAALPPRPWRERIHATVAALAGGLADYPGLARTVLLEFPASGPASLAHRNQVLDGFAELLLELFEALRVDEPDLAPLSADMAAAAVASTHELMVRALIDDTVTPDRIADICTTLLATVLTGRPED